MKHLNKLKEALNTRNVSDINKIITNTPSVLDEMDEKGISGLMYIAYYQLPEVLAFAVEKKADFTLHEAAVIGLLNKVITKLNINPDGLHHFSNDGFLPVTLACFFGNHSIVEYFIKKGANVNIPAKNPSKVMPLHSAVARNDFEICKILLKNGADVNAAQARGVTPLQAAAHSGNLEIVKLLVENGADISAKMEEGDTALSFAEKDGQEAIVVFLKGLRKVD